MNERAREILEEVEALSTGHFKFTSGKHGDTYMQCAKAFQYPHLAKELMKPVADFYRDKEVDIVLAPAIGAITIGYEMASQLETKSLFTEREDGTMVLRRGQEIKSGDRVLIAEDVTTTGGTVKELIQMVEDAGATLVGIALVVDRSGGEIDFGYPAKAAYTTKLSVYEADDCPLCKDNVPITAPGSRARFEKSK